MADARNKRAEMKVKRRGFFVAMVRVLWCGRLRQVILRAIMCAAVRADTGTTMQMVMRVTIGTILSLRNVTIGAVIRRRKVRLRGERRVRWCDGAGSDCFCGEGWFVDAGDGRKHAGGDGCYGGGGNERGVKGFTGGDSGGRDGAMVLR